MADVNARYIGIARDPNKTNPDPTFYLDPTEVGLDAPSEPDMEVPSSVGMTNRAKRPGPYISSGPLTYQSDIRSLGYWFVLALNGYAYTGGVARVTQQQTLTVATPADAGGGEFLLNVPDENGDVQTYRIAATAAQTAAQVATSIASKTFRGWTVSASGSDVIFTATFKHTAALITLVDVDSGVTGTSAITRPATGGFHTHEAWANARRYFDPLCVRVGKDLYEGVFEQCVVAGIEVTVEREFVPVTVNFQGGKEGKRPEGVRNVATDIVPLLPKEFALAYHDVHFYLDEEGALPVNIDELTNSVSFGIENNVDSERGVKIGSRYPRKHGSSGRGFSLSAEIDFETMDQREAFWGSPNGPTAQGSRVFPVRIKIDAGEDYDEPNNFGVIEILFPRVFFSAVPHTFSQREEMTQAIGMTVQEGLVTLADGTTQVSTAMYVKIENLAPNMTTTLA